MKKLRKTFLSLLLAVALVAALIPVTFAQGDYIDIPDENFARAIRWELGLPDNAPIPRALAAELTHLWAFGMGISSLEGIEYFTALIELDVGGNNLTTMDISNNPLLSLLWVDGNDMDSPDDVIGWQDNENLILDWTFFFHPQQSDIPLPPPTLRGWMRATMERHGASNWAIEQMTEAIMLDLIPMGLIFDFWADIRSNITRAEFCETIVQTLMVKSGHFRDLPRFIETFNIDIGHNPFTDTSAKYVRIAYALGIVTGVGYGRFAPDNPITRQEAAVMLKRAAAVIEPDLFFAEDPIDFVDAGYFAEWARDGIDFVLANDIMRGIGGNRFNPHGYYTREQTFVTMLRLFNAFPD